MNTEPTVQTDSVIATALQNHLMTLAGKIASAEARYEGLKARSTGLINRCNAAHLALSELNAERARTVAAIENLNQNQS